MKCIEFDKVGPPTDVLRCVERDIPTPGPGEVLVRMLASPVNPSDLMFINGTYGLQPELPQVPGFEGVGVVESSGGGLRGRLFQGKRVAVLNRSGGNWAEFSCVPAEQVIPLSSSLSVEQAATFFVNPATAWIMTQEVLAVPRGAWLLQTAAASSLGRMVVRLGVEMGFRTLNVLRRPQQGDQLKALGATEVLVYDANGDNEEEFLSRVAAVTNGDGVRYAVDCVGGATGSAVVRAMTRGGRMLVYGTLSEQPLQFSSRELMTKNANVEGFWLGNFMAQKNLLFKLRLVRRITRLIKSGVLSTNVAQQFSLDAINEAVIASPADGKTLLSIA